MPRPSRSYYGKTLVKAKCKYCKRESHYADEQQNVCPQCRLITISIKHFIEENGTHCIKMILLEMLDDILVEMVDDKIKR